MMIIIIMTAVERNPTSAIDAISSISKIYGQKV